MGRSGIRAVIPGVWGRLRRTTVVVMQLPGGGEIGLYQPKHPTALGLK
jgi:hypothetical protein